LGDRTMSYAFSFQFFHKVRLVPTVQGTSPSVSSSQVIWPRTISSSVMLYRVRSPDSMCFRFNSRRIRSTNFVNKPNRSSSANCRQSNPVRRTGVYFFSLFSAFSLLIFNSLSLSIKSGSSFNSIPIAIL